MQTQRWLGGALQSGGVGLEESKKVMPEGIKVGLGRSRSERLGIAPLGLSDCVLQSRTCPAQCVPKVTSSLIETVNRQLLKSKVPFSFLISSSSSSL